MPSRPSLALALLLSLMVWVPAGRAWASGADASPIDFQAEVAPILETRCLSCHNDEDPKGKLSLATAPAVLRGGSSGPALVPGDPEDSLLLWLVEGDAPEMPRTGDPLAPAQVAALQRWVAQGAPWPEGLTLQDRRFEGQFWWSLEPLARPKIPDVQHTDWVRNPIDAFILKRLEDEGLSPSPEADRRTLIRRLTFNLYGLPPSPEAIEAFVNDPDPQAYENLVERLLASPHYGERWGRHWLDVVHYGDTHGYDKDKRRDHAWPYRDYVIRSFNDDTPYGQFIREQIAGDVLHPGDPTGVIATGFIAAGPWDFVGHVELFEGSVEKEKTRSLDRDDMVANAMSTFVSLTVHCARCHDHKFDPIPQVDYYRLQAVFAGVERGDRPYETSESAAPRSEPAVVDESIAVRDDPAHVYTVLPREPRPIHLLHRGEVEQPGERVEPGALSCVPELDFAFALSNPDDEGARRAALADWLADPRNVLTWRSIVNRVWHYHFGRGLVATPNDFGRNGSEPSHPELLDWLAIEFRERGQSIKDLHRLILTSATYRQASAHREAPARVDAGNRLLWRMNRQRLDAEAIRDSVLALSGTLNPTMGGPGVELFRFQDDHSPVYDHTDVSQIDRPEAWRRTVYRFVVRSVPNPFLETLDCADPNINVPVRTTTITALQALALLNNPFMVKQAEYFAERLESRAETLDDQVATAVTMALGRAPRPEEHAALVDYAARHGLANTCRLLFNTNEFVFID